MQGANRNGILVCWHNNWSVNHLEWKKDAIWFKKLLCCVSQYTLNTQQDKTNPVNQKVNGFWFHPVHKILKLRSLCIENMRNWGLVSWLLELERLGWPSILFNTLSSKFIRSLWSKVVLAPLFNCWNCKQCLHRTVIIHTTSDSDSICSSLGPHYFIGNASPIFAQSSSL